MTVRSGLHHLDNVSRETFGRLRQFEALLIKWNPAINLVSRTTISELWQRHFVDSAQLAKFLPVGHGTWVDLGAGGGFPGVVIAIIAAEVEPAMVVTLVESDQRKATFLRQVCRETGIKTVVLSDRIEKLAPLGSSVISARALAPLSVLCGYAARHGTAESLAVFQKGATYQDELLAAKSHWEFDHEVHASQSDPAGVTLAVRNIRPALTAC